MHNSVNILKPTKLYTLKSKRCGLWIIISQKKKRERKKKKKKIPLSKCYISLLLINSTTYFPYFSKKTQDDRAQLPSKCQAFVGRAGGHLLMG